MVLGERQRPRFGQPTDAVLGGVVDIHARSTAGGYAGRPIEVIRGDVDDVPAPARHHDRSNGPPEEVDAFEVRSDLIVEVVESLGPGIQRGSEPNAPSVGHRDVDAAVFGDDPLDDLENLIRLGDVGDEICSWAHVESHHCCSRAAQGAYPFRAKSTRRT